MQITWACFPVAQWQRIRRLHSPTERLPNPLAQQVGGMFCFTSHLGQRIKINTNVAGVMERRLRESHITSGLLMFKGTHGVPDSESDLFWISFLFHEGNIKWNVTCFLFQWKDHFHIPNLWFASFIEMKHRYQGLYTCRDETRFSNGFNRLRSFLPQFLHSGKLQIKPFSSQSGPINQWEKK